MQKRTSAVAQLTSKKWNGRTVPRERTALAIWFWEIDRVLLSLIVALMAIGLVAVAAASPVGALDRSTADVAVNPLYYFYRQIMWICIGFPVMLVISMLPRTQARRLSLFLAAFFFVMLMFVPVLGSTINGAKRWIDLPGFRFQPSEFLKPVFVVTLAWLLSIRNSERNVPVIPLTFLLTGLVSALLMRQPDFGQTVIFCACWGVLLMLADRKSTRLNSSHVSESRMPSSA